MWSRSSSWYGTRRLIAVFTRANLEPDESSRRLRNISLRFILISFFNLLRFSSNLLLSVYPTNILYAFLVSHLIIFCDYCTINEKTKSWLKDALLIASKYDHGSDGVFTYTRGRFFLALLYLLTELSPSWGAANCAAIQELPSILWNPKFQYRVHNSPPLVPILSHIYPIHTILLYLSKIHFNIVHQPMSCSSQWFLSFSSPDLREHNNYDWLTL
jgi:hypothetical protein